MRPTRTFQVKVKPMGPKRIEVSTFEPHSSKVVAAALLIAERMNSHVSLSCLVVNCPYIPLVFQG